MATAGQAPAAGRTRTRHPRHPARKRLGLAVLLVTVGSFLPWVYTSLGALSGVRGAGLWTFTVGMLGLAGMLLPNQRIAGAQAAIMAAVCLVLPAWQVVHVLGLVGLSGWMPGPGVVMVFAGGLLSGAAALQLFREPVPSRG